MKFSAKQMKLIAESKGFEAFDDGVYTLTLRSVTESEKDGPSGFKYLKWEFEVATGEHKGRRLWTNTSLSPKAAFKLKELFAGFGIDLDAGVDTKDLIDVNVKAKVVQVTQQEGKGKGGLINEISGFLEAEKPLVVAAKDADLF